MRRTEIRRVAPGTAGAVPARLRVLHVVVQAGPTNSQWNEHCLPAADQHRITVCSLFPSTVPADSRIKRLEGDGSVRGAMRVLRAALRSDEYDVVHVHAPASAALLIGACVLERRRWDDVVFTVHNSWPNLRRRNQALATLALAVFPVGVACSRSAAESMPGLVRRLARRPVEVVTNGVDVDRVDQALRADPVLLGDEADTARRASDGITVVTVGRLIPIKDQATLLTAFAASARPQDRLVLVGEGPLRAELEQLAARLGISDRVRMPGLVPRDTVYRMLGDADVYASVSLGEGLPLSVLEALAAGLPAVLSDIPPHQEVAAVTTAAQLVRVGDADALAERIIRLQRMPANERAALGRRGRKAVVDRFSVRAMTQAYRCLYAATRERTQQTIGAAA